METVESYANYLASTWPGSEPQIWAEHLTETMKEHNCSVRAAYDILYRQLLEDRADPKYFD